MYTVATVILNFVGNGRCSRALDWSAEAACRAEAGFRVNQTIIPHFCVIITSLLRIMTGNNGSVITCLYIIITSDGHYYALIRLLFHHYYMLLL